MKIRKDNGIFIVLLFGLAILYLVFFPIGGSFESRPLLFILNSLFLTAAPLYVAYSLKKSYDYKKNKITILLSSGLVVFALLSLLAGIVGTLEGKGPNEVVTAHNLGVLFSSFYFLWASNTIGKKETKDTGSSTYLLVPLILSILVTILVHTPYSPQFFIPGEGPTLLRQIILGTGSLLYAITAISFLRLQRENNSNLLFWYSLALILMFIGFIAIFLQKDVGSIMGWVGRSAQYIGATFFIIALREER